MDIRDDIVRRGVEAYLDSDGKSCIMSCPRSGKTYMGTKIMKNYSNPLICFPRKDIISGWLKTFKELGYDRNYTFSTFNSLKYQLDKGYDLVIIDEIHECSPAQLVTIGQFESIPLLGLSGTMTQKTRSAIFKETNMDVCFNYPINKGVEDGILADYTIFIHTIELDDIKKLHKKNTVTEKKYFRSLDYVRGTLKGNSKFFMELKMISLLQNSESRTQYTRKLIEQYKNKRILIFCGNTVVADSLGVPVYHSKKREEQMFKDFCEGRYYKHMATVKMAQAGIGVAPISIGIINYTSGSPEDCAQKISRMLCLEYDNPDKKAEIHLISSNETFETDRVDTALSFFDNNKIKDYEV